MAGISVLSAALKDNLSEPDWSANLELCDELNSGADPSGILEDIHEKLLLSDSDGEYIALVLLDTVVKNCDKNIVKNIDEEIISTLIEISDREDSNAKNCNCAYEMLQDWFKTYELRKLEFPALFSQEKELEHTFFLRFNNNMKPEFLHQAVMRLENDLAHTLSTTQDCGELMAKSDTDPSEISRLCQFFRFAQSRLRFLIENGALDGLAEELFETVLTVHDKVADGLEAAQFQLWMSDDYISKSADHETDSSVMKDSTGSANDSSSHKRKRSSQGGSGGDDDTDEGDGASSVGYIYKLNLECTFGSSDKFYELALEGAEVRIRYGRRGSQGVLSVKSFGNVSEARDFMETTAEAKRRKGYVDTVGSDVSAGSPPPRVRPAPSVQSASTVISSYVDPSMDIASAASSSSGSSSSSGGSSSGGPSSGDSEEEVYMVCTEGSSDKFYHMKRLGSTVELCYGRRGTQGASSQKQFATSDEACKFIETTANAKKKKNYRVKTSPSTTGAASTAAVSASQYATTNTSSTVLKSSNVPKTTTSVSTNGGGGGEDDESDLAKLERGEKVFVKGSSALPYTCKKFNGGYSCTCPGWKFNIKNKGIQACSCKHLKEIRGVQAEEERCATAQSASGTGGGSAGGSSTSSRASTGNSAKNLDIPRKISLAQKWSGNVNLLMYAMSEKLDGMRAYWDGAKLWTRSGLPIITPDWFTDHLPSDLELDGELFLGRKMFDETMSITRRNDGGGDWHKITYVVFDAPTVQGGILTRLDAAKVALASCKSTNVRVHPHETCQGEEHLLLELARVEGMGGEGLMLRKIQAAHRAGRNTDLLKVKTFHDDEALITDYEAGKGKYNGMVGSLVCVRRDGGKFKVGSGLNDSQRIYSAAPKIGSVITFKYFELSSDGIPRFPTFLRLRPDVSPSEFPSP